MSDIFTKFQCKQKVYIPKKQNFSVIYLHHIRSIYYSH